MTTEAKTTRTRDCAECGEPFSYEVGRGKDRALCSDFCRTKRRHRNAKAQPLCVVEGCQNRRQYKSGICNSCYCRQRDTGSLGRREHKYRAKHSSGYVLISDRSHPLSSSNGYVFEHRKVLFAAIGSGPHPCFWCGDMVDWMKGVCAKGALVPDHLDGDKANNARGNLVPSCNRCNSRRGMFMKWVEEHRDDPVLWAMYEQALEKASA